jgi:hypothetical protein
MTGESFPSTLDEVVERHPVWIVALLAVAASVSGLMNGFALDDMHIVENNERIRSLANAWQFFGQTYWPADHGGALYRPMAILFFAVQWAMGGGSPFPFHLVNIAAYACASACLYRLLTQIVSPRVALVAAALFAVHPVHTEAVANIVGQSELIVAIIVFVSVERYIRLRREGHIAVADIALLTSMYVVACLFKEHAIVLPALLVSSEALVKGGPARERAREVGPLFLSLAIAGALFVLARTEVLGGVAAGTNELLSGESFAIRLMTMIAVVPEWVRLLVWPASLSADYSFPRTHVITEFTPWLGVIVLTMTLAMSVVWRTRQAQPVVFFAALWVVMSLAIPSNLIMPTGFVLAERTLFLASAGAMLLVALGLARLWQSIPAAESSARTVVTAIVSVLVVAGALRSSARNPAWHDSLSLMRSTVEDVPMSSRAHWMFAEQLERAGMKRQSIDEMLIAVKLGRPDDFILLSYAGDLLLRAGAYDGALRLYRNALAITPHNEMLRSNAAVCLVQLGRFDEARRLARAGLVRANPSERLKQVVALTDSLARLQPKGTS